MKKVILMGLVMLSALVAQADGTITTYAVYSVPVPTDLAMYAQFIIPAVTTTQVGPQISFSYDLPSELVGPTPLNVKLAGTISPDHPLQISGDHGAGTCTLSVDQKSAICQVQYRDLGIDPTAVSNYLAANVKDQNELKKRQQVAQAFGSEPIGIVTYPLSN